MKRLMLDEIDLTKTDRTGAFPCPKYGAVISPTDESQNVHACGGRKNYFLFFTNGLNLTRAFLFFPLISTWSVMSSLAKLVLI